MAPSKCAQTQSRPSESSLRTHPPLQARKHPPLRPTPRPRFWPIASPAP